MEAAVWGLIGTVIGTAASIATTMLTTHHAMRIQREKDSLDRQERVRAFQRDNLLQVQETLQDALRLMGRAHTEDVMANRRDGVAWGKSYLSDEVDQNSHLALRRMFALTERVADDALRLELTDIRAMIARTLLAKSEIEADAFFADVSAAAERVMGQLGKALRAQY